MRVIGRGLPGLLRGLGLTPEASRSARKRQLAAALESAPEADVWLAQAVLTARLPTAAETEAMVRVAAHHGGSALVARLSRYRRAPWRWFTPRVSLVENAVFLDLHETATSKLRTGVQRVSRNLAEQWLSRDELQLVGWSTNRHQLRLISHRHYRALRSRGLITRRAIVPIGGHYILPEVVTDKERTLRIHALARFSSVTTGLVGADAIPLTTAETTGSKMPGVFAKYLAAAIHMDRIAAISEAAATEYRGWRTMLSSAGLAGPEIVTVMLAEGSPAGDPRHEAAARELFLSNGDRPLLLCVGTHEPRKNHLAVIHAAELLWREGQEFSLVFVGGNGWKSDEFRLRVRELQQLGRDVRVLSGVSDDLLWWGYHLARFTLFPSLNEGFGLPVAESLAAGTPVITSDFGSMAEIAAQGGCLLIDPRSDASLTEGMRALLGDDDLRARLAAEARRRAPRSWEQYADEVWQALAQ